MSAHEKLIRTIAESADWVITRAEAVEVVRKTVGTLKRRTFQNAVYKGRERLRREPTIGDTWLSTRPLTLISTSVYVATGPWENMPEGYEGLCPRRFAIWSAIEAAREDGVTHGGILVTYAPDADLTPQAVGDIEVLIHELRDDDAPIETVQRIRMCSTDSAPPKCVEPPIRAGVKPKITLAPMRFLAPST